MSTIVVQQHCANIAARLFNLKIGSWRSLVLFVKNCVRFWRYRRWYEYRISVIVRLRRRLWRRSQRVPDETSACKHGQRIQPRGIVNPKRAIFQVRPDFFDSLDFAHEVNSATDELNRGSGDAENKNNRTDNPFARAKDLSNFPAVGKKSVHRTDIMAPSIPMVSSSLQSPISSSLNEGRITCAVGGRGCSPCTRSEKTRKSAQRIFSRLCNGRARARQRSAALTLGAARP